MREIVLDTETTGFDPFSGDRIVEIGAVELLNHLPTGNVYHQYINPERSMPEDAFAVHGLGDEFLRDKPVFAKVGQGFLDYIGDANVELERLVKVFEIYTAVHGTNPKNLKELATQLGNGYISEDPWGGAWRVAPNHRRRFDLTHQTTVSLLTRPSRPEKQHFGLDDWAALLLLVDKAAASGSNTPKACTKSVQYRIVRSFNSTSNKSAQSRGAMVFRFLCT